MSAICSAVVILLVTSPLPPLALFIFESKFGLYMQVGKQMLTKRQQGRLSRVPLLAAAPPPLLRSSQQLVHPPLLISCQLTLA